MPKTHLVFSDAHAVFGFPNDRADLLGQLIYDIRPDVVIDLGDTADMPSLSSYDKGTKAFVGRSYTQDIAAHNEFQDRVWHKLKRSKKKLPKRIRLIGNHEQRIERAINIQPELEGTIGYRDLDLDSYYDIVVPYDGNTPGTIEVDEIFYAHYFVSGVMGRPISGEHPAYSLLTKNYVSCTQGHTHVFDHTIRSNMGKESGKLQGLTTGCFMDFYMPWAGQSNKIWWRGCFIKRNVEGGSYDLEAISMSQLKQRYEDGLH